MASMTLPEPTEDARKAACEQYRAAQQRHSLWLMQRHEVAELDEGNWHLRALAITTCARRAEMCEPSTRR